MVALCMLASQLAASGRSSPWDAFDSSPYVCCVGVETLPATFRSHILPLTLAGGVPPRTPPARLPWVPCAPSRTFRSAFSARRPKKTTTNSWAPAGARVPGCLGLSRHARSASCLPRSVRPARAKEVRGCAASVDKKWGRPGLASRGPFSPRNSLSPLRLIVRGHCTHRLAPARQARPAGRACQPRAPSRRIFVQLFATFCQNSRISDKCIGRVFGVPSASLRCPYVVLTPHLGLRTPNYHQTW